MYSTLRGGVLIGDGGYANDKILLTPFRSGNCITDRQKRYQHAHIRARNVIERLFGQLKNKFRICFNGIQTKLSTTKNIIVALAVLFNISKQRQPNFFQDAAPNDDLAEISATLEDPTPGSRSVYRDLFIAKYFSD